MSEHNDPKVKQTHKSALRTLEILKLLKGRSLTGLSNGEIAKALATTPQKICVDLATLAEAGFVAKLENDRYALSVALLQIAVAHQLEMQKAQERLAELSQRVLAGANH
jgi:DNA-binding IclR family transcriptional regulator